ncbi:MAG: hypothetical protein KKD77_23495 [Gammaproteobacteria bacterium]|nr:hypothetical protein [Gammaproteobacteria bacterium]
MAEWHVTPDYITNNWTEELLELMVSKLVDRQKRQSGAIEGAQEGHRVAPVQNDRVVKDTELFRILGRKLKVVKNDGD